MNLTDHLDIIPEDNEFFSAEVKYKFDFDRDISQSTIWTACDVECLDEHATEIIDGCDNDSSEATEVTAQSEEME